MKNNEIQDVTQKIQIAFGKESAMLLSSKEHTSVDTISSGKLLINKVLGIGG